MKLQSTTMVAAAAVLLPSTTLEDRSTELSRSLLTHHDENHSKRLLRSGTEESDDEERMRNFFNLGGKGPKEPGESSDLHSLLTAVTGNGGNRLENGDRIAQLSANMKLDANAALARTSRKVFTNHYQNLKLKDVLQEGSLERFRQNVQKEARITSDAAHKITVQDFVIFLSQRYETEQLETIVANADTSDESVKRIVDIIRPPEETPPME
ncbi:hypothetical protein PsorP6_017127 [Peronosclerospora sorghi]|uniref:Uncharacterized protein n=1 Tax=Peronosclerospora sorghi TaxID=230839 RepID=A0ACC0WCY8_9STRA|nr:hypothetical protein PsorP6_017127 [Peronosclerospora sorghi]